MSEQGAGRLVSCLLRGTKMLGLQCVGKTTNCVQLLLQEETAAAQVKAAFLGCSQHKQQEGASPFLVLQPGSLPLAPPGGQSLSPSITKRVWKGEAGGETGI